MIRVKHPDYPGYFYDSSYGTVKDFYNTITDIYVFRIFGDIYEFDVEDLKVEESCNISKTLK